VKLEANPAGALLSVFRERAPHLKLLVGYGGVQMLDGLRRGAVGVQPGCSFVELYIEIWRRFRADDIAGASDLHTRLLPFLSYWMQSVELIIAAEKLISVHRGLIADPYCRRPRYELDDLEVETIDRFCEEFAPLLSGGTSPRS
jgi:4-hydroxy-tetrahydrodipicolinate synthase